MSGAVDLFLIYQFIKRLATPFDEWEAYDRGIIDERGNILKDKRERRKSIKDRNAFGKFDLLVLKLKKLLEKVPGGRSRLGSYAAALWLVKEHKNYDAEMLTEEDILETFNSYKTLAEQSQHIFDETPTTNVGGGQIAGVGVGPQGEPGFTPAQMKRYKKKNKKRLKKFKEFK